MWLRVSSFHMVRTSVKHTRFATTIARLWTNTVEATLNVTELSRRTPHPTPSAQQEFDHVRVCRGPKELLLSWHSTCTQCNTSRDVSSQALHLTRSSLFSCAPHLDSSADALHCDETPNGTKARNVVRIKKIRVHVEGRQSRRKMRQAMRCTRGIKKSGWGRGSAHRRQRNTQ